MATRTTLHQLIQSKLRPDLGQYVRARHSEGLGWRRIADDLHRDSGVLVSHETLRSWFQDAARDAA